MNVGQQIIIFIGPDKSGKTTIAKALSILLKIPYFKNPNETDVFKTNYNSALLYEAKLMFAFLKQTNYSSAIIIGIIILSLTVILGMIIRKTAYSPMK